MSCRQELCRYWTGDGDACMCSILDIPTHNVEVVVARRMGAITYYQAKCSCGSRSPQHGTEAHVQRWGQLHVDQHLGGS